MGVVHRDVKPQNIFLTNGEYGFQAKVLDFGIAKTTSLANAQVTQSGFIVGTPAYMSPEQVRNEEVGPAADLYALAVVGFEALTGSKPFAEGADVLKMLFSVLNDPPPRVSARLAGVPAEIDDAFARALAKHPQERPAEIESWVAALADMLECVDATKPGWPDVVPTNAYKSDSRPTVQPELPPTRPAAGQAPVPAPAARAQAPAPRTNPAAPPAPAPATAVPPGAQGTAGRLRFVLREELGRGPLGVVHRGEDLVDPKIVALRVLAPELLAIEGALAALTADLKACAQVTHPALVKTLGFVDLQGRRAIVSEWVSGRNFGEALQAGHKLPPAQILSLGRALFQVLQAIHAKGLVHGSVQPSNVMVSAGQVRLTDLGLGRVRQRFPGKYRAPGGGYSVAADLYGAAAVLYHLLAGSNPTGPALPTAPSAHVAGVPAPLERALLRCLDPLPANRPASAERVLQELQAPQ
jgi:serine/threonine protein kinase